VSTSTVEIPSLGERSVRQLDLINPDALAECSAILVGCGAIGSHLGRGLAHMGMPRILLFDADSVAPENLALQGFTIQDLGRPKVEALAEILTEINPDATITGFDREFPLPGGVAPLLKHLSSRVVVCACVDSMPARTAIYEAWRRIPAETTLLVDGRMAGMTCRVVVAGDPQDRYYERTIFDPTEVDQTRCTGKGTVFAAAMPAARMGAAIVGWLNGMKIGTLPTMVQRDVIDRLPDAQMTAPSDHDLKPETSRTR
jgi:molybdopterin/thiamine biosynthesis adenylyltransferase